MSPHDVFGVGVLALMFCAGWYFTCYFPEDLACRALLRELRATRLPAHQDSAVSRRWEIGDGRVIHRWNDSGRWCLTADHGRTILITSGSLSPFGAYYRRRILGILTRGDQDK